MGQNVSHTGYKVTLQIVRDIDQLGTMPFFSFAYIRKAARDACSSLRNGQSQICPQLLFQNCPDRPIFPNLTSLCLSPSQPRDVHRSRFCPYGNRCDFCRWFLVHLQVVLEYMLANITGRFTFQNRPFLGCGPNFIC